ncbi:MAG TPA: hypothetical protein VK453_25350 [Micromonosporaceae bacterium]|nr:hypothetical protein [Micromonosporaceae bacterium]
MTKYQVTGQCAHVTVEGIGGSQKQLLYKGAFVPESATPAEIKHLLSVNAITAVGGAPLGTHEVGSVTAGDVRAGLDGKPVASAEPGVGEPVKVDTDLDARRTEAQKKLAASGGVPKGTHGEDVWVEAAVARGYSYDDAVKAGKAELQKLLDTK